MRPTYLTQNSARLLDCCQVFAPAGDKTKFYGDCPAPLVRSARLKWQGNALKLSVNCTNCKYVNVLVQDPPYNVNQDYDAVAFCTDNKECDTFTVSIPLAELASLRNTRKAEQGIDIILGQKNGIRYRWRTTFDWSALKPGAEIPLSKPETMWKGY